MSVHIGDVTTWDTGCTLDEQAQKVLEEANEVVDALCLMELLDGKEGIDADRLRGQLLDECADVVQANANLIAMLGTEDFEPVMDACLQRQIDRGRLDGGEVDG